jgi:hypothetical protein
MKNTERRFVVPLLVGVIGILIIIGGVGIYTKYQPSEALTTSAALSNDFIDPYVNVVMTANDYNDMTRSYHRLVVRNTEQDACLTAEEVTVDIEIGAKILNSKHLCNLAREGAVVSLVDTNVEYSNFQTKDTGFAFDVDFNGMPLNCEVQDLFDISLDAINCSSASR